MNSFSEIQEYLFTGEMTFASGAVMFVVAYWAISVCTGLGLDALDFDLDFDTDTDVGGFDGFLGIGLVPLRWLNLGSCLLYTSPSPRDRTRSRMPSSA